MSGRCCAIIVALWFFLTAGSSFVRPQGDADSAKYLMNIWYHGEEDTAVAAIETDGEVGDYRHFWLAGPSRLVVDVYNLASLFPHDSLSVKHHLVKKIRIGVSANKIRVVLDLAGEEPPLYEIRKKSNGVEIRLKRGSSPAAAKPR